MKKIKYCTTIVLFSIIFLNTKINTQALEPQAGFNEFVEDIDDFELETTDYTINGHNGSKSFMGYKTITDKSSNQYSLQQQAYTDEEGFRKIEDRYCVAIGTAFNAEVGQYFTVELENGEIIECIIGDIKANKDTDKSNVFSKYGCCLEFIVDTKQLNVIIKKSGDCSSLCEEWDSPCVKYIIYDELNYLEN